MVLNLLIYSLTSCKVPVTGSSCSPHPVLPADLTLLIYSLYAYKVLVTGLRYSRDPVPPAVFIYSTSAYFSDPVMLLSIVLININQSLTSSVNLHGNTLELEKINQSTSYHNVTLYNSDPVLFFDWTFFQKTTLSFTHTNLFIMDPDVLLSGTDDTQLAGGPPEDFSPEKEAELLASDKEDMDVEQNDDEDDSRSAAASESFCSTKSSTGDPSSPRPQQLPLSRAHNAIRVARLALMSGRSLNTLHHLADAAGWLASGGGRQQAQPLLHGLQLCYQQEHLLLL